MKQYNSVRTVQMTALAVIAVGFVLIYWQINLRDGAQARVKSLQASTPDRKKVESDLEASRDDVKKYADELEHLEKGVPTTAYVATLLKELETLGNDKKLSVTGVRPVISTASAPTPTPVAAGATAGPIKADVKPYDELDIDITGRGTYDSVMQTVEALQKFPKIVAVKTLSIQPKSDPESKKLGLLDTTISIKAYIFKEGDSGATKNMTALDASKPDASKNDSTKKGTVQ